MSAEKKTEDQKADELPAGFDMYRFMNRWDVILFVAFLVAFLVFTTAIFLLPQAA